MPGHEARTVRLLDEEVRRPAQEIGAEDVLGRIDDLRMMHKLVDPGEKKMRLVPEIALQRLTGLALVLLQALAIMRDLGRGERGNGKVVSVSAIRIEGIGRYALAHRGPPAC